METQKGTIDVETFVAGVVQQILVEEGENVPVGTPLAIIANGTQAPASAAPITRSAPDVPAKPAMQAKPPRDRVTPQRRVRVTPTARKHAEKLGVDLSAITGTGPGGAIVLVDVEQAAARTAPSVIAEPSLVTSGMQAAIAAAMARSKREIPHYYLSTEIDMHRSLEWLKEHNVSRPVTERVLYAALLLKAVAVAVGDVPEMNGYWQDGAFQPASDVHVGVAIALRGGGLIAPAIHSVEKRSLADVMAALQDLVARARTGKLRSSELSDATITVTNLGEQGAGSVFGVIYPPQVALVGFGRIVRRPWTVDGLIGVRPIVTASLSGDHRASVGHRGSVFLTRVESLLQEPERL